MDGELIAANQPGAVSVTTIPDWVDCTPWPPAGDETADTYVYNGVRQLLRETQVDLRGPHPAWFYRSAQRVLTRAGAEQLANFIVQFDPAYQWVEVHRIRVLRDGEIIEHAQLSALQTFRRESDLERSKLSGMLTVSLVIPDIRLEDIVEVAATVHGENSVLRGKYAAWAAFDPLRPSFESRHRVLRPVARAIAVKQFNNPPQPDITVNDGIEDSRWISRAQPRSEAEPLTPPWQIQSPAIQLSEFTNWNEIASLFVDLYESADIPAPLAAEIDQLAAAYPEPAVRAAEWLRFVQGKLRYFALALNEGGLIPCTLDTIWQGRFGDCKDAAKLYVAGARRLGLDACAALISTTHAPAFDSFLPSPNLFNHCIVRLRLDGKSYWLDPTLKQQSGNLDNIFAPYTGWALPLSAKTQELEKLADETPILFLKQEWDFFVGPKPDSPAKVRRRVEHFSWTADAIRNGIANQGASAYAKEVLKELQAIWPDTVETEPLVIEDDPVRNRFTTILGYEIRNGWKPAAKGKRLTFKLVDFQSPKELALLKTPQRRADIHLGRPRKVMHVARMHMPRDWPAKGWNRSLHTPAINILNRLDCDGRMLTSVRELTVAARTMPGAQLADYNEAATKLHENLLSVFAAKSLGNRLVARNSTIRTIYYLVWGGIMLLWLLAQMARVAAPTGP